MSVRLCLNLNTKWALWRQHNQLGDFKSNLNMKSPKNTRIIRQLLPFERVQADICLASIMARYFIAPPKMTDFGAASFITSLALNRSTWTYCALSIFTTSNKTITSGQGQPDSLHKGNTNDDALKLKVRGTIRSALRRRRLLLLHAPVISKLAQPGMRHEYRPSTCKLWHMSRFHANMWWMSQYGGATVGLISLEMMNCQLLQ